jgi:hypothetical protein
MVFSPQENATDRDDGWGSLLAERGLYCLPTGQRFELAETPQSGYFAFSHRTK